MTHMLPSTATCLRRLGLPPLTLVRTDSSFLAAAPDGSVACRTSPQAQTIRRANVTRLARRLCSQMA